MRTGLLAITGLMFGTAMAVACGAENKLNVTIEEGANARRANLPSVPTLPPPPPAHPQGSNDVFTVYGIRHFAAKNWQKEVTVRGHIVFAYEPMVPGTNPPRKCTPRDRCTEDKPHIFIADSATEQDQEKWIMVTGYAQFQQDIDDARLAARSGRPQTPAPGAALGNLAPPQVPVDFYRGAEVTVTGAWTRRAPNGMANSAGLLHYVRHTTVTPSPEDPAARRAAH